jgi:hypothetical protein
MKNTSLADKLRSIPSSVIQRFETLDWKGWCAYCVALFTIGATINVESRFAFPHFFAHQILLIAATTLLMYAMKSFFRDIRSFGEDDPLLAKIPQVKGLYQKRYCSLQKTPWLFLISFLVMLFFFSCILLLEYIQFDTIGIYAIYIAGSSIMIGTYAYGQYLFFLWFIYQIGSGDYGPKVYNVYMPAETVWVKKIAKISQKLRNFFLSVALLYTLEFSLLIPVDKIELNDQGLFLHTPNNVAFVLFWFAFLLLVVVAFPIINYTQHKLVVRVIKGLKSQTILELSTLMFEEQHLIKDKRNRMYTAISYHTLIENVRQTKDYPINRQISYETLMTLITFIVHMINLISKVTNIFPLNGLLTQP